MPEPTRIKTVPDSVSENTEPQTDRAQSVKGEQTQQNQKGLENTEGVNALEPEPLETDSFLKALIEHNQNKELAQDNNQVEVDVEALQQLIAEGADPTQLFEETAAGEGEPTDGGGIYIPTIDRTAEEVLADTGFDTTVSTEIDEGLPNLTISDNNGAPTVTIPNDEVGASGSDISVAENATLTGQTFTITAPNGLATVAFDTTSFTAADMAAASADSPLSVPGSNGVLSIINYNSSTGVVTYSYDPMGTSTDHSSGNVVDEFSVTVTDINNDTNTAASLDILITDTASTANADIRTVGEDDTGITGNVVTGLNASVDAIGADPTTVTGVTAGNSGTAEVIGNVGGAGVAGSFGTLTVADDGTYGYVTNAAAQALLDTQTGTDKFSYTIKDSDGDFSTTTFTFTITGADEGDPTVTIPNDEAGVGGSDISVAENATLTGQTFTITAPDGLKAVSFDSTNFTKAELEASGTTPLTVTGSNGTLTITGYNTGTGVITYSYDPTGTSTDHSSGNVVDEFSVTVTDINNDTNTAASLDILITDTSPTANADIRTVGEDDTGITGNVETGTNATADTLGADSADITGVQAGTTASEITTGVNTAVSGTYGDLTIQADGSYTYVTNASAKALNTGDTETDTFSYTLKDSDGDFSTTTFTFTISGVTITVSDNDLTPVANADVDSGVEGGTAVTGNVMTGTDVSGGDSNVSDGVADGVGDTPIKVTAAQQGVNAITIGVEFSTAAGGKLTLNEDGSYSYIPPVQGSVPAAGGIETFDYTITDVDGDTSSTTLTINVATNSVPTISVTDGTVDEKGLVAGSGELADGDSANNSDASETTTGTFTYSVGNDTPEKIEVQDKTGAWITVSDGSTVQGDNGVLTISETGGAYSWSYTLDNNVTHTGTDLTGAADQVSGESFGVRVSDSDPETSAVTTLDITINDDGPTISADSLDIYYSSVGESFNGSYSYSSGADLVSSVTDTISNLTWNDMDASKFTFSYVSTSGTVNTYTAAYVDNTVTKTYFNIHVDTNASNQQYTVELVNPDPSVTVTSADLVGVISNPVDTDNDGKNDTATVAAINFNNLFSVVVTATNDGGANFGPIAGLDAELQSNGLIGVDGQTVLEQKDEGVKFDIVPEPNSANVNVVGFNVILSTQGSIALGEDVDITVNYTDGTEESLIAQTINGINSTTYTVDFDISLAKTVDSIELYPGETNQTLKVQGVSLRYQETDSVDSNLEFTITGIDGDGDSVSADFNVNIEARVDNLMLVLDTSRSMDRDSGVSDGHGGTLTRFDLQKVSANSLLDQYEPQDNVNVRIVTFATPGIKIGDTWATVSEAREWVNGDPDTANFGDKGKDVGQQYLAYFKGPTENEGVNKQNIDSHSRFDEKNGDGKGARAAVVDAFDDSGATAAGQNKLFWMSDGLHSKDNVFDEAAWKIFLNTNNIDAEAYIMGEAPDFNDSAYLGRDSDGNGNPLTDSIVMNQVAYDGATSTDTGSTRVTDLLNYDAYYIGNDSADTLTGDDGGTGAAKNDMIEGGADGDTLTGLAGNDLLVGGADDDLLIGGVGNDHLIGGDGSDTFKWGASDADGGTDRIADFTTGSGGDVVDLRDLLDKTENAATLDEYLHFELVGSDTLLHISTDGDFDLNAGTGSADEQVIRFENVDLVTNGGTDHNIITTLLNDNNLMTNV